MMPPLSFPGRGSGPENEALLRIFIDHAPAALAMFDREMRYLAVSQRWLEDYGLLGRDILGFSHYEVFPEIGEDWKSVHRRAMAGEVVRAEEDPFVRADGRTQWLCWEVRPWLAEEGRPGGIIIFSEDITRYKEAEAAQRHLADVLRAIRKVNLLITRAKDRDFLLSEVCAILTDARGYASAWVGLVGKGGELGLFAFAGMGEGAQALRKGLSEGEVPECCREALSQPELLIRRDIGLECPSCPLGGGKPGNAALGAALRYGDKVYGVLVVSLPSVLAQDLEEQSLFREVVGDIGYALHTMEAEEEGLASRSKLLVAMESMTDAVFISDLEGRFLDFNYAFAGFHKFRSKAECAKTLAEYPGFLEVYSPAGEPVPLEGWAVPRALRGEVGTNVEYRLRRRDTGEAWIGSYSFAPLRDEAGRITGSVVVGRDVTEQRAAELALRESEARFTSAFHASPAAMGISRLKGGIFLDVNEAFIRLYGYEREEVIGRSSEELGLWYTDNREITIASLRERKVLQNVEMMGHRKDGEHRDLLASLALVDLGGEACILGILTDITERKRSEARIQQALAEKESLLRELYHRTKNNMLTIIGMMSLRASTHPEMCLQGFVDDISQRIVSMALVHEKLYQYRNLSRIDLGEFIAELARLELGNASLGGRVGLDLELQEVSILVDTAMPMAIVLGELLTNALRHAFPGEREGCLGIKLSRSDQGLIELVVWDDGIGLPGEGDRESFAGYGLGMIHAIIEQQLQGSITLAVGQGTRYLISFKDDLYKERV